jgi:uncharacterized delta-60 repeat protein
MTNRRKMRRRPALELLEGRSLLTAGALDPTFGGDGFVTQDLGSSQDGARAVAVQPWDNKVVVACDDQNPSTGYDFTLIRYNPDGTLDTSFGNNGVVTTDFAGGTDRISTIVFTPNHAIYAVGSAYTSGGLQDVGVARYTATGALDTSFGSGGKVTVQGMGGYPEVRDSGNVAILDPSGRLIVGGSSSGHNFKGYYYADTLFRFTTSGSLDKSFGKGGKVVGAAQLYAYNGWSALRLEPAGGSNYRIDAVGKDNNQFVLARFTSAGAFDNSLGSNGKVVLAYGDPGAIAFAPDGSGKFVGAKAVYDAPTPTCELVRYNADGTPDGGFNTNGQVIVDANSQWLAGTESTSGGLDISAVSVDSSGRIVVAGDIYYAGREPYSDNDTMLARFNPDGSIDTSFGINGLVSTDLNPNGEGFGAVAILPVGQILAVGSVDRGYYDSNGNWVPQYDVLVARFLS